MAFWKVLRSSSSMLNTLAFNNKSLRCFSCFKLLITCLSFLFSARRVNQYTHSQSSFPQNSHTSTSHSILSDSSGSIIFRFPFFLGFGQDSSKYRQSLFLCAFFYLCFSKFTRCQQILVCGFCSVETVAGFA